ncbi:hypothetical protein BLNAU_14992 [Blattamonas nauphoetae]|uniref:Uncharacterized protein n=1 Tax=Blattamonas nauphoetae TaxID=2049346 RepID=A0ABQ9XFS0_9EUKA|nr:hypothetical protein BLNAU_14992 [Blattamonas nauphoetae]
MGSDISPVSDRQYFSVKTDRLATITRTMHGRDDDGACYWSSVLLSNPFTSGVVSVTITLLSFPCGSFRFGLMDSKNLIPEIGTRLGGRVKNSVGLARFGSLWFNTPSSGSYEYYHSVLKEGDCVRMEVDLDSTPRTVRFFVNGEAVKLYVGEQKQSDGNIFMVKCRRRSEWIALLVFTNSQFSTLKSSQMSLVQGLGEGYLLSASSSRSAPSLTLESSTFTSCSDTSSSSSKVCATAPAIHVTNINPIITSCTFTNPDEITRTPASCELICPVSFSCLDTPLLMSIKGGSSSITDTSFIRLCGGAIRVEGGTHQFTRVRFYANGKRLDSAYRAGKLVLIISPQPDIVPT